MKPVLQFHYTYPARCVRLEVYARSRAEAVRTLREAGYHVTPNDFRDFAGLGKAPFCADGALVVLSGSVTEAEAKAAFPARRPEKGAQPEKPPARKAVAR